jgi:CRISPR-associated endonuclease/helicase Cas3
LAEVGVGTLDQAMMAVMPFKHNNLRILGLNNKILLADEIHACDAYMSRVLESLIEKQASDGNCTICFPPPYHSNRETGWLPLLLKDLRVGLKRHYWAMTTIPG